MTSPLERAGLRPRVDKALAAFQELRRTFDAEETRDRLTERGFLAVTPAEESYPERLRRVPDPPPALFVGGSIPGALLSRWSGRARRP